MNKRKLNGDYSTQCVLSTSFLWPTKETWQTVPSICPRINIMNSNDLQLFSWNPLDLILVPLKRRLLFYSGYEIESKQTTGNRLQIIINLLSEERFSFCRRQCANIMHQYISEIIDLPASTTTIYDVEFNHHPNCSFPRRQSFPIVFHWSWRIFCNGFDFH